MPDGFALSLGGLDVRWGLPVGGSVHVELRGELDHLSVPVLRQALERIYAQGCHRVHIDLRHVAFIDSSGLGALVGAWRHCHAEGGEARAVAPTDAVRQLMDLTGTSRLLLPS